MIKKDRTESGTYSMRLSGVGDGDGTMIIYGEYQKYPLADGSTWWGHVENGDLVIDRAGTYLVSYGARIHYKQWTGSAWNRCVTMGGVALNDSVIPETIQYGYARAAGDGGKPILAYTSVSLCNYVMQLNPGDKLSLRTWFQREAGETSSDPDNGHIVETLSGFLSVKKV